MKFVLKSFCFMLLLSWNVHAYASGDNFFDKITDIEADILYGEAALAELPAEALVLMEDSSTFADGESIIVFDEAQGIWQEKQVVNAGLGHSLHQVACVLGGFIGPFGFVVFGSVLSAISSKPALLAAVLVGGGMALINSASGVIYCLQDD